MLGAWVLVVAAALPVHRVVFHCVDSEAADDYVAVLSEAAGGAVHAKVSFASGAPDDRFVLELSPRALAEGHGLLMVGQGNDRLAEAAKRKAGSKGVDRSVAVEATTLPFLPSRRVLEESRLGRIGTLTVGRSEQVSGLMLVGEVKRTLKVRKKEVTVTASRFAAPGVELLVVRELPGLGKFDLIVALGTPEQAMEVRSVE